MAYQHIKVPDTGEMIVVNDDNSLTFPLTPSFLISRGMASVWIFLL